MPTVVTDRALTGNDFSVFISEQTNKAAVNANPIFTPVRRMEGKGVKKIGYTSSGEVKSDRQARAQIQDTKELMAELSTEVSRQSIGFLIAAIHGSETQTSVTSTVVAATSTGFTSTNNDFANLSAGDYFWPTGFAAAGLNGIPYFISVKTSSNSITTVPAPSAAEAAGASVTIKRFKSVSGSSQTYYALQTRGVDKSKAGEIDYHTIFDGIINTINLEIGETGIVTSSLSMLFEQETAGTAVIAGQTTASETTDDPISAVNNIKDFYVNNTSAKCVVKSLSIEVNNNYTADKAAGCSDRYGYGDLDVSGSVSVRAPISAPFTWRDYSYNGTPVAIGVRMEHGAGTGNETIVVVRRVKVTEHTQPDGSNVIASSQASFAAEEDPTYNTTIEVFRNWS